MRTRRSSSPRLWIAFAGMLALSSSVAVATWVAQAHAESPHARFPILPQQSASIHQALGVYVTQRGQSYFENHLVDLIASKGFSLDEGEYPGFTYQAAHPIALSERLPERFRNALQEVRGILRRLLREPEGYEIKDPLIHLEIPSISYEASFSHLGLRLDEDATRQRMAGKQGVVLDLTAEIPQLKIETDWIHGNDINNAYLGIFGVNNFWAGLAQGSAPLRLDVPVALELDHLGHVHFDLSGLQSNLNSPEPSDRPRLDLGFSLPMLLPEASITIDDTPVPIDPAPFEQELLSKKPELIDALQPYLARQATQGLPALLNQTINQNFADTLSDYNEMDPPGAGRPTGPSEHYHWGIRPEELQATRDYLMIGFSSFIDDPLARDPRAEVSRRLVTAPPALNLMDPSSYDIALTISEDLINRILGLGFQRGYYPTLNVKGQKPLRLLQAPEFRFTSGSTSDHGKLHVKVSHEADGTSEDIALRTGQVTFEMDLNARLVHTQDGKLSVVVDSVDVPSLVVNTGSVRHGLRRITVGRIHGSLVKANLGLAQQPTVIVDALPVPNQLDGIPIRIQDFRADPNGYLVLYLSYDLTH